ncbi:hypothetical protein HPB47_013009 [Ixodes persulcatus]|uniref:Uncharacterized protein n=1 Tax=Ixodes persulcatus TaxID=34615 RepID=A0AC60NRV6_IXOPE|nr:hypothetical protein HPB47_013009 [Ixodes persulcatus]
MLRLGVYADKHHQSFAPSNIIHHVEMRSIFYCICPRILSSLYGPGRACSAKPSGVCWSLFLSSRFTPLLSRRRWNTSTF